MLMKPYVVEDPNLHTMGSALHQYLEIKMHPLITAEDYNRIVVLGEYAREELICAKEKKGKRFNWQRPTARVQNDELHILCPPGLDYVFHYASLIGSYLAINGSKHDHVFYDIPEEEDCLDSIRKNMQDLECRKTVVIGFGLEQMCDHQWKNHGSFQSAKVTLGQNQVTLLGCKHSLWGDISAYTTRKLASKGAEMIIYIGKLGCMVDKVQPNQWLASGGVSLVKGRVVIWKNIFECLEKSQVLYGPHYTSPSTILETRSWLKENPDFHFVDPEIGHFALAASKEKIGFSYLHLVSNNLTCEHTENLGNERIPSIISKRRKLINGIERILCNTALP
jgi:hypothetical protein